MTTPYTIPHNAQDISDAIGQVVNADSVPQNPSQNMVTSEGIKTYVDTAITNLTTNSFSNATLVTEADNIVNNDNDDTIPTSAAVKSYVDNVGFTTGYTELGTTSASGTASTSGFIIGAAKRGGGSNYTSQSVTITVGSITFNSNATVSGSTCLSIPIAAGETYSVTVSAGGASPVRKIYFKAFA